MEDEITLEEIGIIRNQLNLLITHLVIMNQKIWEQTQEFEKIYQDDIEKLRKNLDILVKRKEKKFIGGD